MGEQHDATAQGRATIKYVFPLTGRGLALVLENGFEGAVPGNGTVRGSRGASAYTGPEFADGRDASGARVGWLAVVATASDAAELFRVGDAVAFFP